MSDTSENSDQKKSPVYRIGASSSSTPVFQSHSPFVSSSVLSSFSSPVSASFAKFGTVTAPHFSAAAPHFSAAAPQSAAPQFGIPMAPQFGAATIAAASTYLPVIELSATFCDSSSFRSLIESIKLAEQETIMIHFNQKDIHLQHINSPKTTLTDVVIHSHKLSQYFNSEEKAIKLSISSSLLHGVLKNFQKKDSIYMFKYKGDSRLYFTLPNPTGHERLNVVDIRECPTHELQTLVGFTPDPLNPDKFYFCSGESNPIYKFPLNDFGKFCTGTVGTSVKSTGMIMRLHPDSISVTSTGGKVTENASFGQGLQPQTTIYIQSLITTQILKSWSKLHKITLDDIMRIYFDPRCSLSPIMFSMEFGHCGAMNIVYVNR